VFHPPYLNNCENLPKTKPFSLTLSQHITNKQTNRPREKPRRCIQYSLLMPSCNTWQKNRQKHKGLKATRCIRWSCNALSQHTLQKNRQVGKGQKKHICCSCNASILEEYRWQLRIETVPQSLASCRTVYNMILSISSNISEDSNHPRSIDNSNNYRHMDIRAMPTKTEATAQQWPAYSKVNGIISCNFWNAIYPTNTCKHAFKHIS
jgi:hypothetical protein